ncbi:TonB-dependent receptor [Caulobacter endophyticus]|uniref:TonB-dependent receptor n=1 Tax=Caulobacter endophyticus TaxID=2172652 RepID=UPI0024105B98|nr:TonB-dependent receptor [Caulobacter endophyticus]MDG2530540.1 TonB-dependent receptor [Caulobacter endophyticus]
MHRPKRGRLAGGLAGALLAVLTATPDEARAMAGPARVDVRAGPLGDALDELAREQGLEILFSDELVRGLRVGGVRGRLTPDQALTALLAGADLDYRVTRDGSRVLVRRPPTALADPGDGAVSEILVVGRRTQNAGIRRTQNDIQPYKVAGPRELAMAPQDNLDQLFRDRMPSNGQVISPSQYVLGGAAANSAIDLRGVGLQRTLVLVDGRRLPGLPTLNAGFGQADLNAVPLGLVERIETLTATAGGIHGPAAVGGVVNLVLDRDYRGADLTLVTGLSSRGDAGRARLELRAGFTPNDGRTDVMLAGSYAAARPLTAGRRDYADQSLQRQAAKFPSFYLSDATARNAIVVRSWGGEPLRLDARLGGTVLPSHFTLLPIGFSGTDQERAAVLVANAGKLSTEQPPGLAGADTSLVSTPRSGSLLVNVRHQASDRLELFVDGLYLSNKAFAYLPQSRTTTPTHGDAGDNPFANTVLISFPVESLVRKSQSSVETYRLTGGALAALPGRWQAAADYTVGRTVLETRDDAVRVTNEGIQLNDLYLALWYGATGPSPRPFVLPLGDYEALQTALGAYLSPYGSWSRLENRFVNAALRAAGPLLDLPGGPLTLTVLGEFRREHAPATQAYILGNGAPRATPVLERGVEVRSAYAELRAPLVAQDAALAPLRGLELQAALRRDDVETTYPLNALRAGERPPNASARHRADVFTLGARALPASWLMLRASLATGESPPDLRHLQEVLIPILDAGLVDPRRGGRSTLAEGPVTQARGGSHKVGQEKGRTLSAGVVFNPEGRRGPRLSIDVSRVDIRDELVSLQLTPQAAISGEALYPEWIDREPLSAADAALGYTAGRITKIYSGFGNVGRTRAETVDLQLDWTLSPPPPLPRGQVRLYGAATWQPVLRSKLRRGEPWLDRAGYRDSPLEWRSVSGVEWTRGPLSVDLNVQYLGGYDLVYSAVSVQAPLKQPSEVPRMPSQTYVDLVARRRIDLPDGGRLRSVDLRLAVQNLLDASPPILAEAAHMGYDYRGDPRRRRFELLVAARF